MSAERIDGLIYDCEIVNCVPSSRAGFKKIPQYKYCRGWDDFKGMEISCICAWDLLLDMPRIFTRGNFADFHALCKERKEIIGFNSLHFDDKLIAAHSMPIVTTYDLMVEIKRACGRWAEGNVKGVFGLGAICAANELPAKTEKGSDAPIMWQAGQYGRVIDYCMNDVMLCKALLERRDAINVKMYSEIKTVCLREIKELK